MEKTRAQRLRAELKAAGYNSQKVSVRDKVGAINVTVKDLNVDYIAIENMALRYQNVSYCEYSGEILSGGNTFVFVDYSDEAEAQIADLRKEEIFDCNKIGEIRVWVHDDNDIRIELETESEYYNNSFYQKKYAAIALHKLLMKK